MDYKSSAAAILKLVGGQQNVSHLEHCSTRLRFSVNNKKLVDEAALKKIPGVMGVIINAQVQVVIGNNVIEMYEELAKICRPAASASLSSENKKPGAILLEFIVGIFQPLVPAIAGAGVLKSILILMTTAGWMSASSGTYQILNSISTAAFYYLPLMVAVTTATKMNTNRLVALVAVSVLLLPSNMTLLAEGTNFLGIAIKNVVYNSLVFPAILSTLFLGVIEKAITKISPKAIRIFFVPMVSLAITIPVTLFILGPLGYTMGEYLRTVILFLHAKLGFLAIALLAGILPFMIATGMHKAMLPYAISTFGELGYEILYLPASLAHNISESGACFAVAVKAKDKQLKSVASSAAISALMGITEPALYGITLQNKRVLYSIVASGFMTGGIVGFLGLKSFVIAGPGLANITMFVDPNNSMNFIYGLIGLGSALILSFLFVLLFWKEDAGTAQSSAAVISSNETRLVAPMKGKAIELSKVNDPLFASKALGEGIAIIPELGEVRAPADGQIKMVFETKHSAGMEVSNGAQILFHIGIDTVQLQGQYFTAHVKTDDFVKQGDLLLSFELDKIREAGYDLTTTVIVTNSAEYDVKMLAHDTVDFHDTVLATLKKG